eukprot:CAMPEP_0198495526 /NCGR_PEP_ID=MMETSP1462-20131121/5256_1 /TAXON_ID=1333877 /ORGANISM="Brandtodinium nutriculum, Strain RCC3387" /LENGTH=115 /DNA_ID=CAMNT_0044224309 /DNA_START=101 /DNA_END=444 /DNA_ORIENTATION=+
MSLCTGEIGQPAAIRTVRYLSAVANSFALKPVLIALAMGLGSAAGRSRCRGSWALFMAIGAVAAIVRICGIYLTVRIPSAIAHGNSPLGLDLQPWHAVPCTLLGALPSCVAAVWL